MLPVAWCGVALVRNVVGSRSVPLSEAKSILARTQQRAPSSLPASISPNSRSDSPTGASRYTDGSRANRPFCCSSAGDGSTYASPRSIMARCAAMSRSK